jgi:hypothetical protein
VEWWWSAGIDDGRWFCGGWKQKRFSLPLLLRYVSFVFILVLGLFWVFLIVVCEFVYD